MTVEADVLIASARLKQTNRRTPAIAPEHNSTDRRARFAYRASRCSSRVLMKGLNGELGLA
jgi:hypothetical protein